MANAQLIEHYQKKVIEHFIKNHYVFTMETVKSAIKDLNFFHSFYDSLAECLEELYPKKVR